MLRDGDARMGGRGVGVGSVIANTTDSSVLRMVQLGCL